MRDIFVFHSAEEGKLQHLVIIHRAILAESFGGKWWDTRTTPLKKSVSNLPLDRSGYLLDKLQLFLSFLG